MDSIGSLLALAARQHGVVAVWQVRQLGIATSTFRQMATRQGWIRRHRGVWSPPGTDIEDPLGILSAALLACPAEAAATANSALWLHGLQDDAPARPVIWLPRSAHVPRHLPVTFIQSSSTIPTSSVRRLPTASPGVAIAHLARPPAPSLDEVRDLVAVALQRRSTTADALLQAVEEPRTPGAPLVRRAVHDVTSTGADSPFSLRVHERLLRSGRRPDPRPATVDIGGRILHPDLTFTNGRVAIEADGVRHHTGGRALSLDQSKDRAYRRAGWEPLRLTWFDLTHRWAGFVEELDRLLARPLDV